MCMRRESDTQLLQVGLMMWRSERRVWFWWFEDEDVETLKLATVPGFLGELCRWRSWGHH